MGVFDEIADALSGKSTSAPAAPAPKAKVTGDFDEDMEIKRQNNARMGLDINGDPIRKAAPPQNKPSGIDAAMSAHADKLHPVKR